MFQYHLRGRLVLDRLNQVLLLSLQSPKIFAVFPQKVVHLSYLQGLEPPQHYGHILLDVFEALPQILNVHPERFHGALDVVCQICDLAPKVQETFGHCGFQASNPDVEVLNLDIKIGDTCYQTLDCVVKIGHPRIETRNSIGKIFHVLDDSLSFIFQLLDGIGSLFFFYGCSKEAACQAERGSKR